MGMMENADLIDVKVGNNGNRQDWQLGTYEKNDHSHLDALERDIPLNEVRSLQVLRAVQSLSERVIATAALVVLLLPLVIIGLLIRLNSSGPALFVQERVGKNGRVFRCFKFRTMVDGADDLIDYVIDLNDQDGVLFKVKNDPRCTSIGKVLRRYSIDEFPQLINIALGEMSFVGPRPPLPGEVAQYGVDVRRRLLVKPGLTGLWQVSGRSNLSWEESVRLDLEYVENWSPLLDAKILLKTVPAVLSGHGAY